MQLDRRDYAVLGANFIRVAIAEPGTGSQLSAAARTRASQGGCALLAELRAIPVFVATRAAIHAGTLSEACLPAPSFDSPFAALGEGAFLFLKPTLLDGLQPQLPRNHWQRDVRWVIGTVIDGLRCNGDLVTHSEWIACVEVAREAWEVGTRNLDANLMPRLDDIARRPKIDLVLINLTRLDGCWLRIRFAETRA